MNANLSETDPIIDICFVCGLVYPRNNFKMLDDSKKNMITTVFPDYLFNISIDDNQKICQNCVSNLEKCYYFKMHCLKNPIRSKTILLNDKTCKLCLKTKPLNELREFKDEIKNMVIKCFKELDLGSECLAICLNCHELLLTLFNFYELCTVNQVTFSDGDLNLISRIKEEPIEIHEIYINPDTITIKEEEEEMESLEIKNKRRRRYRGAPTIFFCTECSYRSDKPKNLNRHRRRHGSPSSKRHKCDKCDYKTHDKSNLIAHQKIHTLDYQYTCAICGHGFYQRNKMDSHILKNHNQSDPLLVNLIKSKIHTCLYCDYKTVNASHLKKHLWSHNKTGAEVYKCDLCDYETPFKYNLKSHSVKHTHPKCFKCDGCEKGFNRKQELDSHILIKHGEEPELIRLISSQIHLCSLCEYRTINKFHLKKHLATHK